MGYLSEKYNYVKGLCDGLEVNEDTKEGKLLLAIMELMDEVVLSVEDLEESRDEMNDFLDEIDEDLAELEEAVYEECDCEDELSFGEVECPECDALIELSEDMFSDDGSEFTCPSCGKTVEVEWACDCEDCSEEDGEEG